MCPLTVPPALTVNITKYTESSLIVIQWDEVDDSLITTYIVTWTSKRDHIVHLAGLIEQSSYTITNLTLDTVYTITVTAANRCGTGPEYNTSVSLTTFTVLSTMSHPIMSSSNSSITTAVVSVSTATITTALINLNTTATTTATDIVVTSYLMSTSTATMTPTTATNVAVSYVMPTSTGHANSADKTCKCLL